MTVYHRHHIIPRHAGGTDDPSNIVLLTIEEHAEAHRLLYEEHGRVEDRVAWLALSGQIGKEEMLRQLNRAPRGPLSEEHRAKLSAARKGKKLGPKSEEHKAKLSAANKGKKRGPLSEKQKAALRKANIGRKRPCSEETKAKISAAKKGTKRNSEGKFIKSTNY